MEFTGIGKEDVSTLIQSMRLHMMVEEVLCEKVSDYFMNSFGLGQVFDTGQPGALFGLLSRLPRGRWPGLYDMKIQAGHYLPCRQRREPISILGPDA